VRSIDFVEVPAKHTLMLEGDIGDTFYILLTG
jgi:CRP-like cAMP-binding protein